MKRVTSVHISGPSIVRQQKKNDFIYGTDRPAQQTDAGSADKWTRSRDERPVRADRFSVASALSTGRQMAFTFISLQLGRCTNYSGPHPK
jgi:hypothetical protein